MPRVTPLVLAGIGLAMLIRAAVASADTPPSTTADATPPPAESTSETPAETATWSLSITAGTYIVPDTQVYEQPTLTADYGWLHTEARLNYEAIDAASLWLGYNFSIGETLTLDVTPMVGGVFGDVYGVAPGAKVTLGFWKLELYTEAEYFFDIDDHSGNFAYAWSEVALAPLDWLRFGLVSQRTRAYDTDVDVQRGLLLGVAYRWLSFTTYVFNLDRSEQTVVLSLGASFD